MPKQSLRDVLNEATMELHQQLEALWTPSGGFASEATYKAFLSALLDVHIQMGRPSAEARDDKLAIEQEDDRISALRDDLNGSAHPSPTARTDIGSDYAWGVGYVLNGSSLGASILLKTDSLGVGWPRQYLGLGRDYVRAGHLKRFFDGMNVASVNPIEVHRGAMETFCALKTQAQGAAG